MRSLAAVCAVLLLAAYSWPLLFAGQSEEVPPPEAIGSAELHAMSEVTRISRIDAGGVVVETFPSVTRDNSELADAFRSAIQYNDPAIFVVGPGIFDFRNTHNIFLPKGCRIIGAGPGKTILRNGYEEIDGSTATGGCCFELADGVVIEGCTLESYHVDDKTGPSGQAATVGFARLHNSGSAATLRNCKIIGLAWAVYVWGDSQHIKLTLEDCEIQFGRVGVAGMISRGGPGTSAEIVCRRCKLFGDTTRSRRYGAIYQRFAGWCQRGGKLTVEDCTAVMLGYQAIPGFESDSVVETVRGVWIPDGGSTLPNGNGGAARQTVVDVRNSNVRTQLRGSKERYDAERGEHPDLPDAGKFRIEGGSGSGQVGSWLTKGKVEVR